MRCLWKVIPLSVLIAVLTALLPTSSFGAFDLSNPVTFEIRDTMFYSPSHIRVITPITTPTNRINKFQEFNCPTWGQNECAQVKNPGATFSGTVVIPPCTELKATYCIEALQFSENGKDWHDAVLTRSINGPTHDPVPEINFPYAGTLSLWKFKQSNSTSTNFAVEVSFDFPKTAYLKDAIKFQDLRVRITPFTEVPGNFVTARLEDYVDSEGFKSQGTWPFFEDSVWSDNQGRGVAVGWPSGIAARVVARVPNTLTGWLGGRITDADFNVTPITLMTNQLTISGAPVIVQKIQVPVYIKSDNIDTFQKIVGVTNGNFAGGYVYDASQFGDQGLIDVLRPYASDKSASTYSTWFVKSFTNGNQYCLQDSSRIVGFVATNASAYYGSAPVFKDGKISYSVAAMHYATNGEVARGTYDLAIRSDAARCLYKFSSAPIQASVSITSSGQTQQVVTSVTGERNGWLFISAKNFTFSNPTINVTLSQKIVQSTKKSAIICVKGKIKQVVSGASPRCPAGFKQA